ncbi:helix-turn-helix domain-containing protein [Ferirhizobium litorale]|uniref:Helix-turn-helix domain-containing protein n=1 Tax=Ferirhizobium litorale TaxID=2927786 RepID=A0AAE3QIN9_9HYPH|nr:helix-turn-helix domain-containing protein [Fererhizobium litorale]MDI7924578.1 helix-turn-helix domain-containing protein [Fererhizobium litorale]
MSFDATNWAIKQRGLKPAAKIVLWHLCDRYHPDHGCFPSQETLADDCELPRSTLNVHLGDLERAGLIRREQRRDKGSKRQESTRYRFPFEPGFVAAVPSSPCPEAGHGSEDPVSRNEGEPSPENGESRVQNLDSNPVREPVIEPVNSREGASERDEDRKSIERDFKRWYPTWPTYVSDSEPAARKAWFELSADERRQAAERTGAYVEAVKASGRKLLCSAGVYLFEKRWEKLPEPRAEAVAPVLHKPFGKAWNALRLAELLAPIAPLPPMTATNRMLVERGGALGDQVRREHRERYGWPKVSRMHERAARAEGVTIGPQYVAISEDFELVHVDSAKAEAWRALHAARGWPWLPDMGKHPWLYFPAADGDGEAAVSAALARFETMIEGARSNDHAA